MTKEIYSLKINESVLLSVSQDTPEWMPERIERRPSWLRRLIARALRSYFLRTL